MTNLEKFRYYLKDKPSPDSWIDMGWYTTVAAALQRRVWYYKLTGNPLFCNLYTVFIGPPATGKNLVINPIAFLLNYHTKNPGEQHGEDVPGQRSRDRLIPMGPDTVTFEKLVERLAACTTRFVYMNGDGREQNYTHASMAFVLDELNALFQRHNDRVPKLLLKTYDCGDYTYETKHNRSDYVRRCCMNMIAGATPAILREAQQFNMFEDGFTSRTIFAFEARPRHERFHIGDPSDDQVAKFHELLSWIKKLTGLFGQLTYSQEVHDFLESWYEHRHLPVARKSGPRMLAYYGRKRVHLLKLAAAVHFSDALDYEITLTDVKLAIELLARVERMMALGFAAVGRNELHPVTRAIIRYIKDNGGVSFPELVVRFSSEARIEELKEIMDTLTIGQECRLAEGCYYAY